MGYPDSQGDPGVTIDDAVNKTVMLIIFSSDGLEAAGIKEKKFYAKIVGRDSIGLWIENPKLETTRVRDDNGAIIPLDRRQMEEHVAHVLLPWGNIRSVVYFPMRQGFDTVEDEEAGALGRGMYL
jgi:hypothetical protein